VFHGLQDIKTQFHLKPRHLLTHCFFVGLHATFLTRTGDWLPYSDASPYIYSPYPDYNKKAWRAANQGSHVACAGPDEIVPEVKVFSGHPEAFGESPIGSYVPFGIDSNLCFERGTRLAPYGFKEEQATYSDGHLRKRMDWDLVNWGVLQDFCLTKNADRYVKLDKLEPIKEDKKDLSNFSISGNSTGKIRRLETVVHETNSRDQGLHGKPEVRVMAKSRTAILLRSYTGRKYTQNDKQNIRALVTELSLRSGGEYQVFLLVQIKDDLPLSKESVRAHVPKEFWDMAIPWNDNLMKEKYPRIPEGVNNVHQSQWLSVQFFVQEHPEFNYFWNWELDTRYTGHHYDFLEKLVAFAQAQPRKGLWERNERYYIPSVHGPYDTKFRKTVEKLSGSQSIWGAAYMPTVKPVGPSRPIDDPKYDDYEWGVGEEADYISLAPIFDPANTTWPGRDDVWGYDGADRTPRRATIGTQSRCSRKLLEAMHAENLEGNHVSSEMTPQTVALLHGLKAVYAPMPVFFDRAWNGEILEKYFNPGPNGVSGSSEESPFSWGKESRFNGSTWYYRAVPPKRLYNNWMGWEDSGIGGPEVGVLSATQLGLH
jgi:hypothetical protein